MGDLAVVRGDEVVALAHKGGVDVAVAHAEGEVFAVVAAIVFAQVGDGVGFVQPSRQEGEVVAVVVEGFVLFAQGGEMCGDVVQGDVCGAFDEEVEGDVEVFDDADVEVGTKAGKALRVVLQGGAAFSGAGGAVFAPVGVGLAVGV